jgi:threonine dehydrogenase-like Zn-dependent dehydrogenase
MRAFVRRSARPRDAGVDLIDDPRPGAGEVLLRVVACGLCGSDLHALHGDPGFDFVATPVVLGHEFSGIVEEVGPGVGDLAAGDRVVSISIQGCGECAVCRTGETQLCPDRRVVGLHYNGGLAERVVVARRHLVGVPDGLDMRVAALTEPLSVAVHAVLDRASIRPGQRVVVSGPGPIGLFCARLAALSGGDVLVLGTGGDRDRRLPLAERFGLPIGVVGDGAETTEVLREAFGRRPPDAWIEASGAVPALAAAVEGVVNGGEITVVALFARELSFPVTDAVRRELTMRFSYASRHPDYLVALDLLARGAVDGPALATEFPLAQADRALEAAEAQQVVKPLVVTE